MGGWVGLAVTIVGAAMSGGGGGGGKWFKRYGFQTALNRANGGKKPKKKKKKGLEVTYSGTREPRRIIYGFQRVGGMHVIPPFCTGENGKFLHLVLALAGHEVDSYYNCWADRWEIYDADIAAVTGADGDGYVSDGPYKTLMWIRRYRGTSTQTKDYKLGAAYPAAFGTDFRGRGVAYAALTMKWQKNVFAGGVPEMQFEVRGKRLYDPRKDPTKGGSGTHDEDDSSTWEWYDNPALIARDFLVNEVGFANSEIDDAMVAAAATICESDVAVPPSTLEDRYRCNITLMADEEWEANLQAIIETMQGSVAWVDGKWRIRAGAWETPSFSLTKDDWIGDFSVRTSLDRDERWNAVRASYVGAAKSWQLTEAYPRTNSSYETADGGERIWQEVTLDGVITEYQAQRLGELWLRASRNQITVAGELPPRFMEMQPGDTVTISDDEYGWTSKTFRVVSMSISTEGRVQATFVEEGSSNWTDLAEGEYNAPSSPTNLDPGVTLPGVAGTLYATGGAGRIDFSWDIDEDTLPGQTFRLMESVNSWQGSETEIWRGLAYNTQIPKTDTTTRFYWVQGVVGSYVSLYSPNSWGLPAAASSPPADGTPGTYAPDLRLLSDGQVFRYSGSGTNIGVNTINFEALLTALPGATAGFHANNYRADGTLLSSYNLSGTGNAARGLHINSFTQGGSTAYAAVVASVVGGYYDRITVHRVQEGSDGDDGAPGTPGESVIAGYLTNEAHALPSSANGYVPSYGGANGYFMVFDGLTQVHPNSVTLSTLSDPQGLTESYNQNSNYYEVTGGFDPGETIATLDIRAVYSGTNIDKRFTLTKGIGGTDGTDGTPGTDASLLTLIAEGQAFRFSGSGTVLGVNTIGFDVALQNLGGTAGFYARNYRADGTALNSYALSGTGNTNRGLHVNSFLQNGTTAYCTVVASLSGGYTDQVTVVRLQDGAQGSAGTPGTDGERVILGYLTNQAHTVPASANGYTPTAAYSAANGYFIIMDGLTQCHPNSCTISVQQAWPAGLAYSLNANSNYYEVTGGLNQDKGFLLLRGVYSGTQIDLPFGLSRSIGGLDGDDGTPGADASLISLHPTGQQFRYSGSDTNIGVSTIGFYINRQNIGATAGIYARNYRQDGTALNSYALNSGGLAANSMWILQANSFTQNGTTAYAVVVASAAGYSDRVTVVRVREGAGGADGSDGTSPIVGYLTNEAHTLPASSNGFVSDYSGALGYFHVFDGIVDVHPNSVTLATQYNPQALTINYDQNSNYYEVTGGFDAGEDIAYANITATYSGTVVMKRFTLTKAIPGVDGSDAKSLSVHATGQSFRYSGSGTNIGVSTLGFYLNRMNLSATAGIYANNYRDNGTLINSVALSSGALASNSHWVLHVDSFTRNGSTAYCRLVASCEGYSDRVTVVRLQEGADGPPGLDGDDPVAGYLTNEAHTVPASSDGTVTNYDGANGYFILFAGVTQVHPNSITFSVGSNPQALSGTVTPNATSGYYNITGGLGPAEESARLYLEALYDGRTVYKTFTLGKALSGPDGTDGANAESFMLTANAQAFRYSGSNTNIGVNTIQFDLQLQNLSGTMGIYARNYRQDGTALNSYALSGTGNNNRGLRANSFTQNGTTAYCIVTASMAGGWSDQITIVRLREGAGGADGAPGTPGIDGLVGFLTNEMHSVPSSSNGYVPSYSGANGYFILYLGASPVHPGSITFAVGSNAQGLTGTVTPNATSGYYAVTGGLGVTEEVGLLDMTATFSGTTIQKIFTLGKNKQGNTGDPGGGANVLTNGEMTFIDESTGRLASWGGNTVANSINATAGLDGGNAWWLGSRNQYQEYMNDRPIPVSPADEFLDVSVFIRAPNSGQRVWLIMKCYDEYMREIHSWGESMVGVFQCFSPAPKGATSVAICKPLKKDAEWPGWANSYNSLLMDSQAYGLFQYSWPNSGSWIHNNSPCFMTSVNTTASTSYDLVSLATGLPNTADISAYIGHGVGGVSSYRSFGNAPNNGSYVTVASAWTQFTGRFGGINNAMDRFNNSGAKDEYNTFRQRTHYVRFGLARITGGAISHLFVDEYIVKRREFLRDVYIPDPEMVMGGGMWRFTYPFAVYSWNSVKYSPTSGPTGGGCLVIKASSPGHNIAAGAYHL